MYYTVDIKAAKLQLLRGLIIWAQLRLNCKQLLPVKADKITI